LDAERGSCQEMRAVRLQCCNRCSDAIVPCRDPIGFRQVCESVRGGMTFRSFRVTYPTRRLSLTTYTHPDGKLEQYLVEPAA